MNIVTEVPLFLVWTAGIVLALMKWQRHPVVSMITSLVCGLYILEWIVMALAYFLFDWSWPDLYFQGLSLIRPLMHAGLFALLLWAVFGWRNPPMVIERYPTPARPSPVSSDDTRIQEKPWLG
jgi:hypothetical protein